MHGPGPVRHGLPGTRIGGPIHRLEELGGRAIPGTHVGPERAGQDLAQGVAHVFPMVHRVRQLRSRDVTERQGLAITNAVRTLLDLAAERDIEDLLDVAILQSSRLLPWLEGRLRNALCGVDGGERLRRLLAERSSKDPRPGSS